jgi:uncharacterized protein
MATAYFADTFYFVALLSPRDATHAPAVELARTLRGPLVTTDAVVIEVANALSAPRDRERAASFITELWADPHVTVRPIDRQLLEKALRLYRSRVDKDWGLCDCISFVVMQEQSLMDALTGDEHFRQAGFHTLFPSP